MQSNSDLPPGQPPGLDRGPGVAATIRRAERDLDRIARVLSDPAGPRVVAGPWHSEVGFEVLYWIPFLRWIVDRYSVDPDRLVAVSRGGVQSWYEGIAAHYIDALDVQDVHSFRESTGLRWSRSGGQKQKGYTRWDRELLQLTRLQSRWRRPPMLHPSLMYRLFRRYWKGGEVGARVHDRLLHRRLEPPPDAAGILDRLPSDFIAVKFYFRDSFPQDPANEALVRRMVSQLAELGGDVVLLHTGLAVDDHVEAAVEGSPRVHVGLPSADPSRNLHDQSVLISRARSFVGTYGGFSYLAMLYGVPNVSVASHPQNFFPSHLDTARRAARAARSSFALVDSRRLDHLALLPRDLASRTSDLVGS